MTKFAIIDAVEKPKTQRTGLQLYPWQELDVGKGFFVPDDERQKANARQSARPDRQPMGQAPERGGALSIVPL